MKGTRAALAAIACGALIGIPALAGAQQQSPPGTGEVIAKDVGTTSGRFSVNGTDATTLTIATGGTVKFDYPSGQSFHNVDFDGSQPASCTQTAGMNAGPVPPLPAGPLPPGWAGTCTFTAAGTYTFHCDLHPDMTGKIVVQNPVSATPTPTAPPGATPTPVYTPTPTPTPAPAGDKPQSTLKGAVKLTAHQKGARVRGSVKVKAARSRLEVTLWAKRATIAGGHSRKLLRVGRSAKTATKAGRVAFSVRLTANARAALSKRRRLPLTVKVALTPPQAHKLTRTLHTTLRR